MYSIYPDAIDGYSQLPIVKGNYQDLDYLNRIRTAIINIENELGVSPSGKASSVSERLDDINKRINNIEELIFGFEERLVYFDNKIEQLFSILENNISK